jgi:hypothetical protein
LEGHEGLAQLLIDRGADDREQEESESAPELEESESEPELEAEAEKSDGQA